MPLDEENNENIQAMAGRPEYRAQRRRRLSFTVTGKDLYQPFAVFSRQ
jgi:hypothetical protein